MNYELAQKLRDAGFPKESFMVCEGSSYHACNKNHIENPPTLSELIEACGDNFYSLSYEFVEGTNGEKKWFANKPNDYFQKLAANGKTPEEAVAKLWLELNKK